MNITVLSCGKITIYLFCLALVPAWIVSAQSIVWGSQDTVISRFVDENETETHRAMLPRLSSGDQEEGAGRAPRIREATADVWFTSDGEEALVTFNRVVAGAVAIVLVLGLLYLTNTRQRRR